MGQGGIKAIAVFEFPNAQVIKDMHASEDFNALNELRKKVYKKEVDLMILRCFNNYFCNILFKFNSFSVKI